MEPLSVLANRQRSGVTRLTKNAKILKSIVKAIQDKKGERIVALDLRKIHEAVADFFIICEGGSTTQVKAIADSVEHELKQELEEVPYRHVWPDP